MTMKLILPGTGMFQDLDDWKEKLLACPSFPMKIGMLKSVMDGRDFVAELEYRGDDHIRNSKEGLLFAAENHPLESDITEHAVWYFLIEHYERPFELVFDTYIERVVKLAHRAFWSGMGGARWATQDQGPRPIRKKLEVLFRSLAQSPPPEDFRPVRLTVKLALDMSLHSLFIDGHEGWLGHQLLIEELTNRADVRAASYSHLSQDRFYRSSRDLLFHLAARGVFDWAREGRSSK